MFRLHHVRLFLSWVQPFPSLPEDFTDLRVMHAWNCTGHYFLPFHLSPTHECIHWPFDMLCRFLTIYHIYVKSHFCIWGWFFSFLRCGVTWWVYLEWAEVFRVCWDIWNKQWEQANITEHAKHSGGWLIWKCRTCKRHAQNYKIVIRYRNDPKFRTDRSGQTVQTQIRLFLEEQSD